MAVTRNYTNLSLLHYKVSTGGVYTFNPKVSPNPNGTQLKGLNTTNLDAIWGSSYAALKAVRIDKGYGNNNKVITYNMPEYNDNYIGVKMDFGGYGTSVQYYFKLKFEGTDFLSLDDAHTQGLIDDICLTCSNNHTSYPISSSTNWYTGTAIGLSGYPTHRAFFRPKKKLLQIEYKYYASSIFSNGTSSEDGLYIYTSDVRNLSLNGEFPSTYQAVKCKLDNTWKEVDDIKCKVNNAWKDVDAIYVKKDNEWKTVVGN